VNTIQEEAFIAVGESLGNWIDNKFSPRSRALRNLDQLAAMRDELYEQAHPNLPAGRSCHESGTSTGVRFVSGLFVVEQCIESPYERSTALVLAPDSTETPFDPDNRQHRACARTAVKIVRSLTDQ
jgi:hypothetical protein